MIRNARRADVNKRAKKKRKSTNWEKLSEKPGKHRTPAPRISMAGAIIDYLLKCDPTANFLWVGTRLAECPETNGKKTTSQLAVGLAVNNRLTGVFIATGEYVMI
jgi:hypothetical protein